MSYQNTYEDILDSFRADRRSLTCKMQFLRDVACLNMAFVAYFF